MGLVNRDRFTRPMARETTYVTHKKSEATRSLQKRLGVKLAGMSGTGSWSAPLTRVAATSAGRICFLLCLRFLLCVLIPYI